MAQSKIHAFTQEFKFTLKSVNFARKKGKIQNFRAKIQRRKFYFNASKFIILFSLKALLTSS